MSADTSDPALAAAATAVHAPDDDTCWLVARYAEPGSGVIVLSASGADPSLPHLRRYVDAPAGSDAVFAYATVQGRGLVLLRIADGVSGVRRAKAIVHSRAFAALFPDYLALATLLKAGDLTDALVRERLGIDSVGSAGAPESEPEPEPQAAEDSSPTSAPKAVPEPEPSAKTRETKRDAAAAEPAKAAPVPIAGPIPVRAAARAKAPSSLASTPTPTDAARSSTPPPPALAAPTPPRPPPAPKTTTPDAPTTPGDERDVPSVPVSVSTTPAAESIAVFEPAPDVPPVPMLAAERVAALAAAQAKATPDAPSSVRTESRRAAPAPEPPASRQGVVVVDREPVVVVPAEPKARTPALSVSVPSGPKQPPPPVPTESGASIWASPSPVHTSQLSSQHPVRTGDAMLSPMDTPSDVASPRGFDALSPIVGSPADSLSPLRAPDALSPGSAADALSPVSTSPASLTSFTQRSTDSLTPVRTSPAEPLPPVPSARPASKVGGVPSPAARSPPGVSPAAIAHSRQTFGANNFSALASGPPPPLPAAPRSASHETSFTTPPHLRPSSRESSLDSLHPIVTSNLTSPGSSAPAHGMSGWTSQSSLTSLPSTNSFATAHSRQLSSSPDSHISHLSSSRPMSETVEEEDESSVESSVWSPATASPTSPTLDDQLRDSDVPRLPHSNRMSRETLRPHSTQMNGTPLSSSPHPVPDVPLPPLPPLPPPSNAPLPPVPRRSWSRGPPPMPVSPVPDVPLPPLPTPPSRTPPSSYVAPRRGHQREETVDIDALLAQAQALPGVQAHAHELPPLQPLPSSVRVASLQAMPPGMPPLPRMPSLPQRSMTPDSQTPLDTPLEAALPESTLLERPSVPLPEAPPVPPLPLHHRRTASGTSTPATSNGESALSSATTATATGPASTPVSPATKVSPTRKPVPPIDGDVLASVVPRGSSLGAPRAPSIGAASYKSFDTASTAMPRFSIDGMSTASGGASVHRTSVGAASTHSRRSNHSHSRNQSWTRGHSRNQSWSHDEPLPPLPVDDRTSQRSKGESPFVDSSPQFSSSPQFPDSSRVSSPLVDQEPVSASPPRPDTFKTPPPSSPSKRARPSPLPINASPLHLAHLETQRQLERHFDTDLLTPSDSLDARSSFLSVTNSPMSASVLDLSDVGAAATTAATIMPVGHIASARVVDLSNGHLKRRARAGRSGRPEREIAPMFSDSSATDTSDLSDTSSDSDDEIGEVYKPFVSDQAAAAMTRSPRAMAAVPDVPSEVELSTPPTGSVDRFRTPPSTTSTKAIAPMPMPHDLLSPQPSPQPSPEPPHDMLSPQPSPTLPPRNDSLPHDLLSPTAAGFPGDLTDRPPPPTSADYPYSPDMDHDDTSGADAPRPSLGHRPQRSVDSSSTSRPQGIYGHQPRPSLDSFATARMATSQDYPRPSIDSYSRRTPSSLDHHPRPSVDSYSRRTPSSQGHHPRPSIDSYTRRAHSSQGHHGRPSVESFATAYGTPTSQRPSMESFATSRVVGQGHRPQRSVDGGATSRLTHSRQGHSHQRSMDGSVDSLAQGRRLQSRPQPQRSVDSFHSAHKHAFVTSTGSLMSSTGHGSPFATTSPPSQGSHHGHGSQSSLSKIRFAFRSPFGSSSNANINGDAMMSQPMDTSSPPPHSPPNQRLRKASLSRAFRLKRNSTPPSSPGRVHGSSSSHSHGHGGYTDMNEGYMSEKEESLAGLGLGTVGGFRSNTYRTPSGGIGYTPPAPRERDPAAVTLDAEAALYKARQKSLAEQNEAHERWRRLEGERAARRARVPSNPRVADSRVTSMASSGFSDEEYSQFSHITHTTDQASDEVPQSLSLAVVRTAGDSPGPSPVDQLNAAATAARRHRLRAREPQPSSDGHVDDEHELLDEQLEYDYASDEADRPENGVLRGPYATLAYADPYVEQNGRRETTYEDAETGEDDEADDTLGADDVETPQAAYITNDGNHVDAKRSAESDRVEAACVPTKHDDVDLVEADVEAPAYAEGEEKVPEYLEAEGLMVAEAEARVRDEERRAKDSVRRAQQEDETRRAQQDDEERRAKESVRRAQQEDEERRAREKEEEDRLAKEDEERRAKEEDERRAKEDERRAEEEERRAKEDEERRAKEEEERRVKEAEDQQREAEEMEKRAAAERREAERRAREEEERTRKREEERVRAAERAKAERVAAEKAREEIRLQLRQGKVDGGVMLRGWVTVQTTKSLAWRRRYFHLLGRELRMFKGDASADTDPVDTAPLDGARISHDYEDSQVRGSWKLRDGKGEEFLMFADSTEDKDTILEGLSVAIGT